MKIMQVISQLGNGGAEKLVVELSNELEKNNEVILITFRKIEDWMFFPKKIKKSVKIIELYKNKGFSFSLIFKLLKFIHNEKPDIIHIHLASTLKYFMFIIPFFKNINFIYTIHNTFEPFKKDFEQYSKLWFFKKIKFVCLSKSIQEQYASNFINLDFLTVHNGISKPKESINIQSVKEEIASYKNNSKTKIFLFIGRLSYQKNIPMLVNVFLKLKYKNIKLLIIGEDTSKEKKDYFFIRKQKSDNIIYLGAKENVSDYMKYSDALILTSRHEGLPIVVLEALSIGLPVISTPVGGLVNVIENKKNGFLSKDISLNSILEAINLFLNLSIEDIKTIEYNNRYIFDKKYSIKLCANNYNLLYKEVL